MSKTIPFIQSRDSVAFNLDGTLTVIPKAHLNYQRIIDTLKTGILENVRPLLVSIKQYIADSSDGSITFKDDQLWFEGEPLALPIVDRALSLLRDGYNIRPLLNFLRNILDNPSERARKELYLFMEVNDLPVTPDGHFIAYKMVNGDFTDIYTGKMDNSPGATPNMKRSEVDPDKNSTCSVGLHFAALHYVRNGHYGSRGYGHRLVALKINPRDVVAIPTDYNNSKGRACQYLVLKELDWDSTLPVNTVGFRCFGEDDDVEGAIAADAADDVVTVISHDSAKQTRPGTSVYTEADIRNVKKLLADPDNTLTSIAAQTGMSRRHVARIRDGELGQGIDL